MSLFSKSKPNTVVIIGYETIAVYSKKGYKEKINLTDAAVKYMDIKSKKQLEAEAMPLLQKTIDKGSRVLMIIALDALFQKLIKVHDDTDVLALASDFHSMLPFKDSEKQTICYQQKNTMIVWGAPKLLYSAVIGMIEQCGGRVHAVVPASAYGQKSSREQLNAAAVSEILGKTAAVKVANFLNPQLTVSALQQITAKQSEAAPMRQ